LLKSLERVMKKTLPRALFAKNWSIYAKSKEFGEILKRYSVEEARMRESTFKHRLL